MSIRIKLPPISQPSTVPTEKPKPLPFTLRKDVLVPSKPQINAWADEVNERILKLDTWAVRLAATFGLASEPFEMTPGTTGPYLPEPEREGAPGVNLQRYAGDKTPSDAATKYGLTVTEPARSSGNPDTNPWLELVLALSKGMTPVEQVTLEQRDGRWGLYYYRGPAAFGPSAATTVKPSTVPLKDAPLAVRERFLRRSEAFFRRYVETAEHRLARVKESVTGGDAALAMLESMKLE